jgi:hypothetical protein
MPAKTLTLTETLQVLRKDLAEAMKDSGKESIFFKLETVEVELSGVMATEGGVNGKAEFRVLGIGASTSASGKISNQSTHRIKLTLVPKIAANPFGEFENMMVKADIPQPEGPQSAF